MTQMSEEGTVLIKYNKAKTKQSQHPMFSKNLDFF